MNYLSEEEILDYLMTSDFNEGLTPDEFTFLLLKFRYHYRLTRGKNESLFIGLESRIKEIENLRDNTKKEIESYKKKAEEAERKFNELRERKLTWRERFKGKIILKEDEIK